MSERRGVLRGKPLQKVHSLTKVITSLRRVLQNFGFRTRCLFLTFKTLAQTVTDTGRLCLPALRKVSQVAVPMKSCVYLVDLVL